MRLILIFFNIALLTACATQVTSIKQGQHNSLEADRGFVLLGIQTNRNLKTIEISGPQNIELSWKDLKKGNSVSWARRLAVRNEPQQQYLN